MNKSQVFFEAEQEKLILQIFMIHTQFFEMNIQTLKKWFRFERVISNDYIKNLASQRAGELWPIKF